MTSDGPPLSVAVFSDSASPILNGVSVSVDAMIAALRARGHSVHLFTSRYPGHRDSDPNTHRLFALRTPFARDYPLALPPFYPYLQEFRRQRFDVVHTHTPFTIGFVGLRWAQSHEVPIVTTYHTNYDKYTHYFRFAPKRYLRYKLAKHINFYYNQVDHVLTPSEASKRWLRRHSVHRPITVVPTGVPPAPSLDAGEERRRLGITPDQRILLYAGRIAPEKNLGTLLRAAAQAIERDPRLHLWIVGDGPGRAKLTAQARILGIGDRVRFVGFVPRSDVDRYYAAADLFLFSSMTETQGLVVVEAMSHGLTAIAVQGGGAGEAIVDGVNGYLVRNRAEEMAERLLAALADEGTQARMSDAARQTAAQYSIPAMTDRVVAVYRSVLAPVATATEVARAH